eukprot:6287689-Pyramimonas_sp.AAC.1
MPPPLAQLAPIAGIFPLCPARLVRPVGICPLPSRDRPPLRVYSHSPRAIRPPCGDMPFALTRLATLWCSHAGGVRPPHPAGAAARRGRRQGALSARAARLHGIFPLPSYDWSPLRVYSRSPPTIGPRCGYIPAPLPQLVPVADVFPLTSRNWSPLRMYSRSPPAIGPRCGSLVGYCPPNRSNRPNRPRMSAPAKGESGGRCVANQLLFSLHIHISCTIGGPGDDAGEGKLPQVFQVGRRGGVQRATVVPGAAA